MTRDEKSLQGIGGWLILVAIGLIVSPLKILSGMILGYAPLVGDGTWSMMTDPTSASFSLSFVLLAIFEIAANMGLVVFAVALIVLFFRTSESFPSWFIVFLLSALFISLIDAGLTWLAFPEEPMFDPETVAGLARQTMVCLIWIPYMLVSKRVEATFRRPDAGDQLRAKILERLIPGDVSSSKKKVATVAGLGCTATAAAGIAVVTVFIATLFFAGEQPTLEAISFDTSGWEEDERLKDYVVWFNQHGDVLSLAAALPMEINTSVQMGAIRFARDFIASEGAGLVSADIIDLDAHLAVEVISKQEHGSGYVYKGAIICPLSTRAVMVFAVFSEHGITGVREAVVSAQLWESGELEIDFSDEAEGSDGKRAIKGWFFDPYDSEFTGPVLNSLSDDIKYDEMFPEHPLTAMRHTLAVVRETMVIDGE